MLRPAFGIGPILCVLAIAVCSCGGGGTPGASHVPQAPGSQPQSIYTAAPADVVVQPQAVPSPFDPASAPVELAQRHGAAYNRRFHVNGEDHEAEGVFLSGYRVPYNAIFATQSAYEGQQRPLSLPNLVSGSAQAYAPTLHLGWGGCLEASSFYDTSSSGTTAQFTIYNFCLSSPALIASIPIDADFLRKYVRLTPDGTPSYAVEMYTSDTFPTYTSTWTALLYNYGDGKYDAIVTVPANGGTSPDAAGWSVTELYDSAGECPRMAPVRANYAALHDAFADTWRAFAPSMPNGITTGVDVQGSSANQCFLGARDAAPTLNFSLLAPNSYWQVTSPR